MPGALVLEGLFIEVLRLDGHNAVHLVEDDAFADERSSGVGRGQWAGEQAQE